MSWITVTATAILFVFGVAGSPIDVPEPATDLLPPEVDSGPTLATDLMPPPLPEETNEKKGTATLFLINIYAVKNSSAEDSNDVLHSDVIEEIPNESLEPLAMFLLVVEDENEDDAVNLDEVAKDLEDEGFIIRKVVKDGETRLIKVDLDSAETKVKVDGDDKNNAIERIIEEAAERKSEETTESSELEDSSKLMKIRRKRHLCLKCKLDELKYKHHHGSCGGGCGGGGGYYQPQPVYQQPIVVQPVYVPVQSGYPKKYYGGGGGGYYPPPAQYNQPCNTCGGGGYGQGGSSYSQASAQASASAQSYGR